MKLGLHIMALQHISAVHFINPAHQSVFEYISFLSLLGNGSVNTFLLQQIQATIEELLDTCVCVSIGVYPYR
jgi:hypothetical protein